MKRNEPLRVVITGSHGVGKTSLCAAIIAELANKIEVGFVTETARELVARGYEVNENISSAGVREYINIYRNNLNLAGGNVILCDRCLLDLFVYTQPLYAKGGRLGPELGGEVWDLVKADAAETDLFVYVPIQFPMQSDGVRPDEVSFQVEIDNRILSVLPELSANVLRVSGSLNERTQVVIDEVLRLLEANESER